MKVNSAQCVAAIITLITEEPGLYYDAVEDRLPSKYNGDKERGLTDALNPKFWKRREKTIWNGVTTRLYTNEVCADDPCLEAWIDEDGTKLLSITIEQD